MNRSRLLVAGLMGLCVLGADAAAAQSAAQTSVSPHPTPLEYRSSSRSATPRRAAGTTTLTPWLEEWARDRAERPVRDQDMLDAEANAAIADPDSGVFIRDAVALSSQARTVADRVRQAQARDAMLKAAPAMRTAALDTPTPSIAPGTAPAACRDCLSPDLMGWARQRAYGPAGDAASLRAEAEAAIRAPWSGIAPERASDPALIDALTAWLTEQMRERRG